MTCDRNSVEVNECLVDAIQDAIHVLTDGIKDFKIPSIDPLHQKEMRLEYKNNQVRAKMRMNEIFISGLSTSTVRDVRLKADEDKFHIEVDIKTPNMVVTGRYDGGGSYSTLKLSANGLFNISMDDLDYTWKIDGKPEIINGFTHVRVTSFYMRPDISKMKTLLTNENPESKDLTALAVQITNENWRLLYKELLPFAQTNWNQIGTELSNKIFLKVPYDVLFPIKS
ncbi:circadian clock-controlled protein daywake-like [Leptidea sinapis]|uniref:circadian clock-controlled protein daywake-like n=1 Tax=Leptidea sinapis TaxID=189913 RepID=UPI0021C3E61A|nr:circadian clock-controlled protein daywake-like [Leptidea sinapis]